MLRQTVKGCFYQEVAFSRRAMSKSKKGKGCVKTEHAADEKKDDFPLSMDKTNNILINILAKPGAKQNSVTDVTPEGVGIQINAPAMEGEANTELVKYMSSLLGVRKGDISLHKGFKSRQKTIKVEAGSITADEVQRKIKEEMSRK